MSVVFPGSITQGARQIDFTESPRPNVIRTSVDGGYERLRRRFTRMVIDYDIRISVNTTQKNTFEQWFIEDCKQGVEIFEWRHPHKGTMNFRFLGAYAVEHKGADRWEIIFKLEGMP